MRPRRSILQPAEPYRGWHIAKLGLGLFLVLSFWLMGAMLLVSDPAFRSSTVSPMGRAILYALSFGAAAFGSFVWA